MKSVSLLPRAISTQKFKQPSFLIS